jgi:hypothetical protein
MYWTYQQIKKKLNENNLLHAHFRSNIYVHIYHYENSYFTCNLNYFKGSFKILINYLE